MKKSIFKKVVVLLLIVSILVGNCLTVFADTGSNSNDRVTTYLKLASNAEDLEEYLSNTTLTKDQLRFLGVFMSNFYIPFTTEFGDAGEDTLETMYDNMTTILCNNLSFSESYAEVFIDNLVGLAKSSSVELVFAVSSEAGYKGNTCRPTTHKPEANYYNFLSTMLGNGREICDSFGDKGQMSTKGAYNKGNKNGLEYGYWGYLEGSTFHPVFDFYLDPSDGRTACQEAFINCLKGADKSQGYGYNLFDLVDSDFDGVGNEIDISKLSEEQIWAMSILGMKMRIDCFGDILICGLQHQTVAVPGCMNPYVWQAVDSSGEDEGVVGRALPIINVPTMSSADSKNLYSSVSDYSYSQQGGVKLLNNSSYIYKRTFNFGLSSSTLRHLEDTYIKGEFLKTLDNCVLDDNYTATTDIYGSSIRYGVDSKGKYNGEGYITNIVNILCVSIDQCFEYASTGNVTSDNFTVDFSSNGFSVSARADKWSQLNPSRLDSSNTEPVTTMAKSVLASFYNIQYWDSYDVKEVIDDCDFDVQKVASTVKNTVFKNSSYVISNEKVVNAKNVSLKTISTPKYLRMYRGTDQTETDTIAMWDSASAYFDAWVSALKYHTKTYKKDMSVGLIHGYLNNSIDKWFSSGSVKETGVGGSTDPVAAPFNLTSKASSINALDGMYVIDSLGAFEGASDYEALAVVNYINSDGSTINNSNVGGVNINLSYGSDNTFTAGYSNAINGKMIDNSQLNINVSTVSSLYTTYCVASLYNTDSESKANTIGKLGYRMASEFLPEIPSDVIKFSEDATEDKILTSIRDWLYYLLHPTEGLDYVRTLLTNKVNAFLLGWHNDMVGTNDVGQTVGTTKYRSNVGYVTTPDLSEIQWTNSLINFYYDCIPFLIIVMLIIMVFAYITGVLSIQKSMFGLVIFSVFLFMPVSLVNGVVGVSNQVTESLYGEKFTYWALIQQESYATAIDKAATQDTYSNYLATLYQTNSSVYDNQGGESIVLKWQAPKKMTSLMLESSDTYSSLSSGGQALLSAYFANNLTGESYMDSDSVYMYRSYLDIANYSRYIYRGIDNNTRNATVNLTNNVTANFYQDLKDAIYDMGTNYTSDRVNGYTNTNSGGNTISSGYKIQVALSSAIVNDALLQAGTIDGLTMSDYVGINTDMFNFSIPVFNSNTQTIAKYLEEALASESSDRQSQLSTDMRGYSDADYVGLAAYSLYSESVFYYFSWDLYDLGLEPSSQINSGYKDLLLGQDNAGFFYNTSGNGELKDFMDMKSLFTYIIPYLKQCNDIVIEWDNTYGLFTYDGVPTDEGHWSDSAISGSAEMQQKYWHNLNVARLYSLYTPWVDIMYDCSYAKGETITAMGEKYYVENPLDPASYPDERPMIFSESEMLDYGLSKGDLTKVERLILECNQGMEERMYELLNYYNFSDVTLNTAAAINCTFEFNSTFSENGFVKENHNIYPQSFELSDFSYDAFLRFILSNTTGDELTNTDDFYAEVVGNSSMTTAIVMLVLDVLSVYVLPAFKIFFVIALFLSSILLIICTAFRVDPEQKFIKKVLTGIVVPMIKFLAINIGFAFVISLFMGTGNNAVTQTNKLSISMGDPVVVMLFMLAIDIAALFLYYKVIKDVIKNLIQESKLAFSFVGGVAGGVVGMVAGAVTSVFHGNGSGIGNGSGGGSGSGNVAENGTGVTSSRAQMRGNNNVEGMDDRVENEEDSNSVRRNDTHRDTIKPDRNDSYETSEERKEDINEKTQRGMERVNAFTESMEESARGAEDSAEDFEEKVDKATDKVDGGDDF